VPRVGHVGHATGQMIFGNQPASLESQEPCCARSAGCGLRTTRASYRRISEKEKFGGSDVTKGESKASSECDVVWSLTRRLREN
jgi:hypothetical protein